MTDREQQLEDIVRWLAKEVRLVKGRPDDQYTWDVHADDSGWWQAWICDGWEGAEFGHLTDDPPNEALLIEVIGGIDARPDTPA